MHPANREDFQYCWWFLSVAIIAITCGENTVQPRQGRVKVARQELPGLCLFDVFTRQFLPGYFQPRLAALSVKAGKDLCPPIVPAKCLHVSRRMRMLE
jgi:hypothetical protein